MGPGRYTWGTSLLLGAIGCSPSALGPDFALDSDAASIADASVAPAHRDGATERDASSSSAVPSQRAPLDPSFFFCRVQPEIFAYHRCASPSGCHATNTGLRLDVRGESDRAPACASDVPTEPVPASYYTNLARSRAEVRGTASNSELYRRPLGREHPVTLYRESSPEAALMRAWIEGAP
jgi:hypothetical protein